MKTDKIKFYYKNVTDKIIGDEGISKSQLDNLAKKTVPIIKEINRVRQAGQTPYRDLPYKKETIKKIRDLSGQLRQGCENFIVLGIGGSALGNIALQTALNPYMNNLDESQRKGPRLFVFDNVDPVQFGSFLDYIEGKLDKTVFNCISKSGQTAETAAQFLIIYKLLLDKFGQEGLRKHLVATTDVKAGTLRKIVNNEKLTSLEVPEGVGGRFSVLSPVGLLSAAICGIDIEMLLSGAADMDKIVSSEEFYGNPAAINAAINYHFYNAGKKMSVMMPYAASLKDLADWFRQLWAESLGKVKDLEGKTVNVGPTPIKAFGTTDQHSQVQLYREGPNDKLFTFLQVENCRRSLKMPKVLGYVPELHYLAGKEMAELINSEKVATEYALLVNKRPCLTVLFPQVNEYTVGQFIYLYEVTTSIIGALFNINTYDQPAVELGKQATFALMGKEGDVEKGRSYRKFADEIKELAELDEDYLV